MSSFSNTRHSVIEKRKNWNFEKIMFLSRVETDKMSSFSNTRHNVIEKRKNEILKFF